MSRWSIIASGQGANRIAFLYYAKYRNPAIDDRVLLLNTASADLTPERPLRKIFEVSPDLMEVYRKIRRSRVCLFGKVPSGAGNNFLVGEEEAVRDFDTIRRYIANLDLKQEDAVLGITTLGGGTGNGSLPYIVYRLRHEPPRGIPRLNNVISLGILPYEFEGMQRHFNALCGISRLITYNRRRNSAMLILVDNSSVEAYLGREEHPLGRFGRINEEIIKVVEMLIAPGYGGVRVTIDIADYHQLPQALSAVHFAPCLSMNNDPEIFDLESVIESASTRVMAPLRLSTATMAYFIVRAPEQMVERGKISQEDLEQISAEWAEKNLSKKGSIVRYASLVESKNNTLDVLILLGGFSLKEIMKRSYPKFKKFKENLELPPEAMQKIEEAEENLLEYMKKF